MRRRLCPGALVFIILLSGVAADSSSRSAGQQVRPTVKPIGRAAEFWNRRADGNGPVYWATRILKAADLGALVATPDDGCLAAGWSTTARKSWIFKFSSAGEVEWSARPYGFGFYDLIAASDGHFVAAGTASIDSTDFGVSKFTSAGKVLWTYAYGGNYVDQAYSIIQARDGGYLVTGDSLSLRGGAALFEAIYVWILKIDADGKVQWERAFGCLDDTDSFFNGERNASGVQLADGGYAIAANTRMVGAGQYDFLLIRLDEQGRVLWQKTYGGSQYESLFQRGPHLQPTPDGGMVLAGTTNTFGAGLVDIWVLKLTSEGDIEWQKVIGGPGYEYCNSIRVTPDGGYILAGDAGGSFGLIKLSPRGEIEWDRALGGAYAESVSVTREGGYMLAGRSGSDVLVMKVTPEGLISDCCGFPDTPPHVVAETHVVPVSTWFTPLEMSVSDLGQPDTFIFQSLTDIRAELQCWNLVQPPLPISLAHALNRGLFQGESYYTLTWSPPPTGPSSAISQYRIYRRSAGGGLADFAALTTVPANRFMYEDSHPDASAAFEYALTSIDGDGRESPKSAVLRENHDR